MKKIMICICLLSFLPIISQSTFAQNSALREALNDCGETLWLGHKKVCKKEVNRLFDLEYSGDPVPSIKEMKILCKKTYIPSAVYACEYAGRFYLSRSNGSQNCR